MLNVEERPRFFYEGHYLGGRRNLSAGGSTTTLCLPQFEYEPKSGAPHTCGNRPWASTFVEQARGPNRQAFRRLPSSPAMRGTGISVGSIVGWLPPTKFPGSFFAIQLSMRIFVLGNPPSPPPRAVDILPGLNLRDEQMTSVPGPPAFEYLRRPPPAAWPFADWSESYVSSWSGPNSPLRAQRDNNPDHPVSQQSTRLQALKNFDATAGLLRSFTRHSLSRNLTRNQVFERQIMG